MKNIKRNTLKKLAAMTFMFAPFMAHAATQDTNNVTIELVSVSTTSGFVLVQTKPRHKIDLLGCTSDYWMVLPKNLGGFEETYSMLLTAQMTNRPVKVTADDTYTLDPQFCKLGRLITLPES